ncbi:MAG: enoyl-CoA hydratase/isomerase family protein [Bacteroidota bacterium]
MFQHLELKLQDSIAFLNLNRPEALNALNNQLLNELIEAADYLNQQRQIRVVIIRGKGRNFSAGADLQEYLTFSPSEGEWMERREVGHLGFRMCEAIENLKAISIAQVHGFAVGGGCLLMMACDFRMVQEGCFFSIPEVDLGIPLAWGGIPKLLAEIGPLKTKELVMTCRRFDAKEALGLGLINQVLSKDKWERETRELAKSLAEKPALPMKITKDQIRLGEKQMANAYMGNLDGDLLMSVLKDPESRAATEAYLKKMKGQ